MQRKRIDMAALRHDPAASIKDPCGYVAFIAVRLYAETHPRPSQVTRWQVADMLGVSSKTVQRYIRAGLLKVNERGYVPIEAVDAILSAK